MLKVMSFFLLLAIALAMAATSAHARVDLFGRQLTSDNQPDHKHEGAQVQAFMKFEPSGPIPYPECIKTCDRCVYCTLVYPVELSMCFCADSTKTSSSSTTKQLGIQSSSEVNADGAQVQVIEKIEAADMKVLKSSNDIIPYLECIKTCKLCRCAMSFPIELSPCVCLKKAEGGALPN